MVNIIFDRPTSILFARLVLAALSVILRHCITRQSAAPHHVTRRKKPLASALSIPFFKPTKTGLFFLFFFFSVSLYLMQDRLFLLP